MIRRMATRLFVLLFLLSSAPVKAQTESAEDALEEDRANDRPVIACARPADSTSGETTVPESDPEGCQPGDSLSDYDQTLPA